MIVVRDVDTNETTAREILGKIGFADSDIFLLDNGKENFAPINDSINSILWITSMPTGWLKYHQQFFFKYNKKIPLWIILLINGDSIVYNQLKNSIRSGIRTKIVRVTENSNWAQIIEDIKNIKQIIPNKLLLYSIKSECGKTTLRNLLLDYLPNWTIETMEASPMINGIAASDAAQIVIVGKFLKDFAIDIPEGISPFYVLTMPDTNVQLYLKRNELPLRLFDIIPKSLEWTTKKIASRFFYISPLYEQWRRAGTVPQFDSRFIMWDTFGLPFPRQDYTTDKIISFLSQFNQSEALTKALKK